MYNSISLLSCNYDVALQKLVFLSIDVLLADGTGGMISASRGHSHDSCHLLPKAARGSTIQHQTHFKYLFSQLPRPTYLDAECGTLPRLKADSCDPVENISAHLTERSMVDNTSITTKSALVSVQTLWVITLNEATLQLILLSFTSALNILLIMLHRNLLYLDSLTVF